MILQDPEEPFPALRGEPLENFTRELPVVAPLPEEHGLEMSVDHRLLLLMAWSALAAASWVVSDFFRKLFILSGLCQWKRPLMKPKMFILSSVRIKYL